MKVTFYTANKISSTFGFVPTLISKLNEPNILLSLEIIWDSWDTDRGVIDLLPITHPLWVCVLTQIHTK